MESIYNLSKDYEELFSLVDSGMEVLCYVDYSYRDNDPNPSRDVAKCRKIDETIQVGARGIEYGGVSTWEVVRSGLTKEELFIKECHRMNLEWIRPSKLSLKDIYVIGADIAHDKSDYSAMVKVIQHENGVVGILGAIPSVQRTEFAEMVKQMKENYENHVSLSKKQLKPFPSIIIPDIKELLEQKPTVNKKNYKNPSRPVKTNRRKK